MMFFSIEGSVTKMIKNDVTGTNTGDNSNMHKLIKSADQVISIIYHLLNLTNYSVNKMIMPIMSSMQINECHILKVIPIHAGVHTVPQGWDFPLPLNKPTPEFSKQILILNYMIVHG